MTRSPFFMAASIPSRFFRFLRSGAIITNQKMAKMRTIGRKLKLPPKNPGLAGGGPPAGGVDVVSWSTGVAVVARGIVGLMGAVGLPEAGRTY
jgi:hypothetical protein